MKNISFIIISVILALVIVSCGQKEKIDTSQAPEDVKNAVEKSYQLSKELTDLQLSAAQDMVLDETEIAQIGEAFRYLAIVNNINARDYSTDKYFVALRSEYKDRFDALADTVVFLKDCKGYDALGLTIMNISLEVKNVVELPAEAEPVPADTTLDIPAEE